MNVINLPTNSDYFDLHDIVGLGSKNSLIVTNTSSYPVSVIQSTTKPTSDSLGYIINVRESSLIHRDGEKVAWIRGATGPIIVQQLISTITPFTCVDLPHDLYTTDQEVFRRLRTDPAKTSFFEGREFRTYKEFTIPTGQTYTLKITIPENIILQDISVELVVGEIRIRTVADLGSVTEDTSFATSVPVLRKNNMDIAPVISNTVEVFNGGSITGGTEIDLHLMSTAPSGGRRQSLVGHAGEERGVNPGTYYIEIESNGTDTASGVISSWWEEKPETWNA